MEIFENYNPTEIHTQMEDLKMNKNGFGGQFTERMTIHRMKIKS